KSVFNQIKNGFLTRCFQIVENFRYAAKTRKSGIFCACSARKHSALHYGNYRFGVLSFNKNGRSKAGNAASNNCKIPIIPEMLLLPVTKLIHRRYTFSLYLIERNRKFFDICDR